MNLIDIPHTAGCTVYTVPIPPRVQCWLADPRCHPCHTLRCPAILVGLPNSGCAIKLASDKSAERKLAGTSPWRCSKSELGGLDTRVATCGSQSDSRVSRFRLLYISLEYYSESSSKIRGSTAV